MTNRRRGPRWVTLATFMILALFVLGIADPCDAQAGVSPWVVPDFQTATFVSDQLEFEVAATPLTAEITSQQSGTSFQIPCGTPGSWRITIAVTNNGKALARDALVTDEFGQGWTLEAGTASRGTVAQSAVGSGRKALLWKIGDLPFKETARLTLVVSTDPGGLGSPGTYWPDSGAKLTYSAGGATRIVAAARIVVSAVARPTPALSTPHVSLPGLALRDALAVPSFLGNQDPSADDQEVVGFTQVFTPLSSLISDVPAHDGYPAGFEVPAKTRLEWRVTLTVVNTLSRKITNVIVTENFGAELEVDESTVSVTPARHTDAGAQPPYSTVSFVRLGNEKLEWNLPPLDPGQTATLSFNVYTRVNNGGQQEYSTCGVMAYLNSTPTLKYSTNQQQSIELPPTPVWIRCGSSLRVTVSATELDWQIRKPGTFMVEPIEIRVFANKPVVLSCSGFADLASQAPETGYTIPSYYKFSDVQPGTGLIGWTRAADFSGAQKATAAAQASTWVTWWLWSALEVSSQTRAAEYANTGTLTFAMQDSEPYIEASPVVMPLKEVTTLQVPLFPAPVR